MNTPNLRDLIHEYGREMEAAGRNGALGNTGMLGTEEESRRRAERLYDEIERRLRSR